MVRFGKGFHDDHIRHQRLIWQDSLIKISYFILKERKKQLDPELEMIHKYFTGETKHRSSTLLLLFQFLFSLLKMTEN